MDIKQLRLSKGLTQLEASRLLGMQLRTYQNYESGKSTRDTLKISYILKTLSEHERYSESKGILSLEEIRDIVREVCEKHQISYVYLFGSYAKGKAKETSDVDLFIESEEQGLAFIGLIDELTKALHKNVDLIRMKDAKNNPDFITEILASGIKLYGRY